MAALHRLGRMDTPAEVADTVAFLLSAAADPAAVTDADLARLARRNFPGANSIVAEPGSERLAVVYRVTSMRPRPASRTCRGRSARSSPCRPPARAGRPQPPRTLSEVTPGSPIR
jgi:hypothetical protein